MMRRAAGWRFLKARIRSYLLVRRVGTLGRFQESPRTAPGTGRHARGGGSAAHRSPEWKSGWSGRGGAVSLTIQASAIRKRSRIHRSEERPTGKEWVRTWKTLG